MLRPGYDEREAHHNRWPKEVLDAQGKHSPPPQPPAPEPDPRFLPSRMCTDCPQGMHAMHRDPFLKELSHRHLDCT